MTAPEIINQSLGILQTLKPGGGANASQLALYRPILNNILESYQARGFAGTSFATNVATFTAVATYPDVITDNTYPRGWNRMLCYALARDICFTEGKGAWYDTLVKQTADAEAGALHA